MEASRAAQAAAYTAPVSFGTIGIGNHTIKAIAVKEGYSNSTIAETSFTVSYSDTVVIPTFSPVSGNVLSTESLTINTGTAGASIHYTTDGKRADDLKQQVHKSCELLAHSEREAEPSRPSQ